jgi:predicted nucleic acid-binding protein
MTITDASTLFALVDKKQSAHLRCRTALKLLSKPLLTTWPCFTEAMYFAFKSGGISRQKLLWDLVNSSLVRIHAPTENERLRMQALMEIYHDTPMDMADASLVALAETLGEKRIFTLDSDFYVYRLNDTERFEVVP